MAAGFFRLVAFAISLYISAAAFYETPSAPEPAMAKTATACPHCGQPLPGADCAWRPAPVTATLEPEGSVRQLPKAKTVLQALRLLGVRPGDALVIRNGELLTPDRALHPGDDLHIRPVHSAG